MPYRIVKRGEHDYRVLTVDEGKEMGRHETSEDAAAQIRAIYLNEHTDKHEHSHSGGWAGLHRRGYGG